ncbi:MAG: SAP domain-containing protein [archaeon]|nr:SAP domain-containing protein [archaeon]
MGDIDITEVKNMKVADLRKHLTDMGLNPKGNKPELVERLENILLELMGSGGDISSTPSHAPSAPSATPKPVSAHPPPPPPSSSSSSSSTPTPLASKAASGEVASSGAGETGEDPVSLEKRAQRANRFNIELQKSETEKLEERSKRFGIVSEEQKSQARKQRFGIVTEEDKLAARSQRFQAGDSSPSSFSSSSARKRPDRNAVTSRLDAPLGESRQRRPNGSSDGSKNKKPRK